MKFTVFFILLFFVGRSLAQQCGEQAGGALCANNLCCSQWGWCGSTEPYCGDGCQSQCPTPTPTPPPPPPSPPSPPVDPGALGEIITEELFNQMLLHRNNNACPARGFYNYNDFIKAAQFFPEFGISGSIEARKREIAAFFAQTSHETTGGWASAPDGPYAWGYCFVTEVNPGSAYCDWSSTQWPCAPGRSYHGRGPIQLSWNYNYGQCGEALGLDLLHNPDLVASDGVISFETALWFWMTPQSPKPSCHDVMIGEYVPTPADIAAGRLPGYGLTTNIINGGLECGFPSPATVISRIGFYLRYCNMLGVDPGPNLDCANQRPFGFFLNNMVVDTK